MPDLIRLPTNPFAETPRRTESAARAERIELGRPWKTVREMRSTVAALPPKVKGLLAEDMRRRSGLAEAQGPAGPKHDRAQAFTDLPKEDFKALFAYPLAAYLERELLLDIQIGERLRRGEDPKAIRTEIMAELDRMSQGSKAPFVDAAHLESRIAESREAVKRLIEHIAQHRKDYAEKSADARELQRRSRLPPYEKELLRKFKSLRQFLGDPDFETGHFGELAKQKQDISREVEKLKKSLEQALFIERTLEKNAPRLTAEDLADIWAGVASSIGSGMELRIRGLRNLGHEKEAAELQKRLLSVRDALFEAVLAWLERRPDGTGRRSVGSKKQELLARRFNDVFLLLSHGEDDANPSQAANLQHAQIILRRLVQLSLGR